MVETIVRIDLTSDGEEREDANVAGIREPRLDVYKQFAEHARGMFPYGVDDYPVGSFFAADYPVLYFALKRESVALRYSIELMQTWANIRDEGSPEATIVLDRGYVDKQAKKRLGAKKKGDVFERLDKAMHRSKPGSICLARSVMDNVDQTMNRYRHIYSIEGTDYCIVDFDDPRTVDDSSVVHAVFIASKGAEEVRQKAIELFLVEFCKETGKVEDVGVFREWAKDKNYPVPPTPDVETLLRTSIFFEQVGVSEAGNKQFAIKESIKKNIDRSHSQYKADREDCINVVESEVKKELYGKVPCGRTALENLVEDYLAGVFSEIRMMANYFRDTSQVFNPGLERIEKFDYILKRYLVGVQRRILSKCRTGMVKGLTRCSERGNTFIASIFHNVLMTYYLNRHSQTSAYQHKLLRERRILIDTNVLYSWRVPASNFHGYVEYIFDRLEKLDIPIRVFPFTIEEYERSLDSVESHYNRGDPHGYLALRNPWLYQEYERDKGQYLNSMALCRLECSVLKGEREKYEQGEAISSGYRDAVKSAGLLLEEDYEEVTVEDAKEQWIDVRNRVANDKWDPDKYWDFIEASTKKGDEAIQHDIMCLVNISKLYGKYGDDALGPKVLFVTVDYRYLVPLRREYPFVVDIHQLLDFLMPYLFLADMPLKESTEFPNQILGAQLGTLLIANEPQAYDLVKAYFTNDRFAPMVRNQHGTKAQEVAEVLSMERFRNVTKSIKAMEAGSVPEEVYTQLAELVEETRGASKQAEVLEEDKNEMDKQIRVQEEKINKLQRTVKYWKGQARKR